MVFSTTVYADNLLRKLMLVLVWLLLVLLPHMLTRHTLYTLIISMMPQFLLLLGQLKLRSQPAEVTPAVWLLP
jgi:hypothetical protein